VTSLPTILALRDARVYIGTPHHSGYVSNIKSPVDNFLGIVAILVVPDIDPDYLSGVVYTRVEVHRMDSEMSRLVE